jgi:SAM-dependent methyltransferase
MNATVRTVKPQATGLDDENYLDFAEGMRAFTQRAVAPVFQEQGQQAIRSYESRVGGKIASLGAAHDALDAVPIVGYRNRLMRSTQEMKWVGLLDTYGKRQNEIVRELDAADRSGPGSVEWDPDFKYPNYFSEARFHLQPGGYWQHPLAGLLYHHGTKVFFTGKNDNDDIQHDLVAALPQPADGRVLRILDVGCSAGQSATAFKEQYPNAEVTGVDLSAPMVRYAHKRAIDLGLDVNFVQRPAEDTGFPENYFDVAFAFILFHEIPLEINERVCREMVRVLRPGGIFCVIDFANRPPGVTAPIADYTREFDTMQNGERYASDFVYSDFPGTLGRAGFSHVNPDFQPGSGLPIRVSTK